MSPYLIIDALILGTILFFGARGLKTGLIMAVAGALTLALSLVGAHFTANALSPRVEGLIEPFVSGWVDLRIEDSSLNVAAEAGAVTETFAVELLTALGFNQNNAQRFAASVAGYIDQTGQTLQTALTSALTETIARGLTFLAAFLVLLLALLFAARLLDTVAKLPVLNTVNKIGGVAGGLIKGGAIVWIVVYVLSFTSLIGAETMDNTVLLRMFMAGN
ncbi:MAG: CvpA family protein [Oscillospiraceae bacterium]|nr:CvpA family protein [Oscillospiraceae bacterium]